MKQQAVHTIIFTPLFSFMAGILCYEYLTPSILMLMPTFFITIYLSCKAHLNDFDKNQSFIGIIIIFFLAGMLLLGIHRQKHTLLASHISQKPLDIVACITEKTATPRSRIKETLLLSIKKNKYHSENTYNHYRYQILCYTESPTQLEVDDTIELTNISLRKPKNIKTATSNPTFNTYLYKENIAGTFFTKELPYTQIARPRLSIKRYGHNKRNSIVAGLKRKLSPTAFKLVSCIFFGDKKILKNNPLKDSFNFWGISHYLARSGLHVMILLLVLTFSLRPLPLHHYVKRILIILFCLIYGFLSWSSIPFFRALMIFFLCEMGAFFYRKTYTIHLLGLVCLMILTFNPFQLFFLDFQLSFLLTAALCWFSITNQKHQALSKIKELATVKKNTA
jgi:competence protein ComEC